MLRGKVCWNSALESGNLHMIMKWFQWKWNKILVKAIHGWPGQSVVAPDDRRLHGELRAAESGAQRTPPTRSLPAGGCDGIGTWMRQVWRHLLQLAAHVPRRRRNPIADGADAQLAQRGRNPLRQRVVFPSIRFAKIVLLCPGLIHPPISLIGELAGKVAGLKKLNRIALGEGLFF